MNTPKDNINTSRTQEQLREEIKSLTKVVFPDAGGPNKNTHKFLSYREISGIASFLENSVIIKFSSNMFFNFNIYLLYFS